MTTVPDIFGELVSTGLDMLGAGGSAARIALREYLKRHAEQARDILLEEIASGGAMPMDAYKDDAIAIIARYLRAAEQGCARLNLRLLAKCIAGQLRRERLVADEFLNHAEALASLSHDEIVVIARLYRAHLNEEPDRRWGVFLFDLKEVWPEEKIRAVAGRATRSGLVAAGSSFGSIVYMVSPMLLDLCQTVEFDDALRREGKAMSDPPP